MRITTFNDYQGATDLTAIYPQRGDNPYYPALGLAGEAGEVCEKVKKIMRDKDGQIGPEDRKNIILELGDVLWYISALCYEFGVDMETVAQENVEKLRSRLERGMIQGSGDNR
jgi:NTP pyrophosphatase (non-canonical NTP hydrolase)